MSGRIVTLTLNPAVDIASIADAVIPTRKIRTRDEQLDAGGGGINVARVIHALGGETLAVILVGGVTGDLIRDLLRRDGVPCRALPVTGLTRISLNVLEESTGREFRFVPPGPEVAEAEWAAILAALEQEAAAWFVASGSLPRGVPTDIYARVGDLAARRSIPLALDSSGDALRSALGHGIALVKPSLGELREITGLDLPDRASQEEAAMRLVAEGAAMRIAVTLGPDGAFLATREGITRMAAPRGDVRGAVGAGDSFLAGMVLALARGASDTEALAHGIATAAASVATRGTARVTRQAVEAGWAALRSPPA